MKSTLYAALLLSATVSLAQNGPPVDDRPEPGPGPDLEGQPPPDDGLGRPDDGSRPFHNGGGHFRPDGMNAKSMMEGPFLQRLMDKLREEHPQDFERLQQLRQSDPQAFVRELRALLKTEFLAHLRRDRPELAATLEGLKPEDQNWLFDRLRGGGGPGPGGGMMNPPYSPEMEKAEQDARQLADAYRHATNDDEKAKFRADLQAKLGETFDLREKARTEEVRRIEERLGKLREATDTRHAHRDEIIDRRLHELIDGDPLAW